MLMTKITSIPTIGPALYPRVEIWALMLVAVIFIFNTFSERVLKFPAPGGAKGTRSIRDISAQLP